jgi:hypothetical protein
MNILAPLGFYILSGIILLLICLIIVRLDRRALFTPRRASLCGQCGTVLLTRDECERGICAACRNSESGSTIQKGRSAASVESVPRSVRPVGKCVPNGFVRRINHTSTP